MNALLVAGLSALLLAVLFVGWLVWLVNVQPREPRSPKSEFAGRNSPGGKDEAGPFPGRRAIPQPARNIRPSAAVRSPGNADN
ncbi:hypothetical protein P3T27_000516 [Kitasatospora sp. MAA19]|uniref:hypothetical protein n=1 Tax=unclassified Kitasatospora TaxID=2633591 RepID=UPI00247656E1|nr:hypothetical protein [Kitasatospora sp. MAA19]MDH6703835.1 hypothetical protein [Kitasatospora sp. MAA19]